MSTSLRRNWLVAIGVCCIVLAGGVAAAYLPAKRYKASAILLAQPAGVKDFNSISIASIQFLLPALSEQVKSDTFKAALEAQLPPAAQRVDVSASVEPGTGVVRVTATGRNPVAAQIVANAAAEKLIAERLSPLVKISVLNRAAVPTSPASPRKAEILFAAFVLALIAGAAAGLAAARQSGEPRRRSVDGPSASPRRRSSVEPSLDSTTGADGRELDEEPAPGRDRLRAR